MCTPLSDLEKNNVLIVSESGTRRIWCQICMTHVPETGARKMELNVDLWRRFLERVSWVLNDRHSLRSTVKWTQQPQQLAIHNDNFSLNT